MIMICTAGNALKQLKTILCEFGQICATGNSYAARSLYKSGQICERGNVLMLLETIVCEHGRICATGNGLVQLEPNLCNWLLAWTPFRISRQNLNWNVQSPSMWWWLITQPRPIWKKASAGLQRPSHTDSRIPGVLYSPKLPVPHLGPDPRYPWGLVPPCNSIIKKGCFSKNCMSCISPSGFQLFLLAS